ncbi:hypothetical protein BKA63DRAFT_493705 [Paraphoma chrysanthemicola]|nr:hypothetical protein BKA63DRAFT_493705 [Paraphoma chrysanthemicola]
MGYYGNFLRFRVPFKIVLSARSHCDANDRIYGIKSSTISAHDSFIPRPSQSKFTRTPDSIHRAPTFHLRASIHSVIAERECLCEAYGNFSSGPGLCEWKGWSGLKRQQRTSLEPCLPSKARPWSDEHLLNATRRGNGTLLYSKNFEGIVYIPNRAETPLLLTTNVQHLNSVNYFMHSPSRFFIESLLKIIVQDFLALTGAFPAFLPDLHVQFRALCSSGSSKKSNCLKELVLHADARANNRDYKVSDELVRFMAKTADFKRKRRRIHVFFRFFCDSKWAAHRKVGVSPTSERASTFTWF